MAYKKFDDPNAKVSQAGNKVYDAIWQGAVRRAIQSVANRVLSGTGGTAGPLIQAAVAAGGTAGVQIATPVTVLINGVQSTCIAQDNLMIPNGTMGSNRAAKYLISTGAGTSGTCTGPGNVVSCADYASNTLALAACKLPDLPDGHCALGYMSIISPPTTDVVFAAHSATGTTGGTASFTQLTCMPYDA
jgi:hypothetical protein